MIEPKPLARREVLQTAAALGIGGAALGFAEGGQAGQAGQAGGNPPAFAAQWSDR